MRPWAEGPCDPRLPGSRFTQPGHCLPPRLQVPEGNMSVPPTWDPTTRAPSVFFLHAALEASTSWEAILSPQGWPRCLSTPVLFLAERIIRPSAFKRICSRHLLRGAHWSPTQSMSNCTWWELVGIIVPLPAHLVVRSHLKFNLIQHSGIISKQWGVTARRVTSNQQLMWMSWLQPECTESRCYPWSFMTVHFLVIKMSYGQECVRHCKVGSAGSTVCTLLALIVLAWSKACNENVTDGVSPKCVNGLRAMTWP